MRHLDLFSGIGGFALAASWVWGEDHEIVSFCEIEPFPQKVLKKHWPDVPIHDDIKTMKGDRYGRINLLTGGFPCQPYSVAGKQRGSEDDRALWPEMFRIIKEAKPDWIIGENVAGFVGMGLDDSLSDLESEGYETTAFIIPACGVGAQHTRQRVWIVANSNNVRLQKVFKQSRDIYKESKKEIFNIGHIRGPGLQVGKRILRESDPGILRVADGIPDRVDRIKGLGNAIVPHVVVPIMQAIKQIEQEQK